MSMALRLIESVSRRTFLQRAGALSASLTTALLIPGRALSQPKTLKILQWNHSIPGYDRWFNETYIKDWGEKHNTSVVVDNIGLAGLNSRASAEVAAQKGHDLLMFLWPPPIYEDHVIDHREIYEECERKYGKPIDLAIKSTYNPKTKKYYGFSDSYMPDPIHYRKDLWDDVGMYPDSWDDIRTGGKKVKQKHNIPVGIGLASEIDTNMAMRAILYAFGASEQDAEGNPALKSKETFEALKFIKALYEETMTDDVFTWDISSNNRIMLAGTGSLALNAISITREGEKQKLPVTDNIWLAKAAKGPVRRIGLEHVMDVYVIWKFAENIEGAKQFLVDYLNNFRQAFLASEYYNFPCFPQTVPDLKDLVAHDPQAKPVDKYKILEDSLEWATNIGYPGYANVAIDEIFNTWVISTMCALVASGKLSPEDAMNQADNEVRRIFKKWKEKGKI
jgi:multiple sugar transport system substrate-binding protein